MSKEFQRQLVILTNNKALFVYNMDLDAELPASMVLSGQPTPVAQADGALVYKLNHPASGWFGSIKADDSERLTALMQLPDETILLKVAVPVTHTDKDLAKAKPFLGAK